MMQASAIIIPKKPTTDWTRVNRKWEYQLQKRVVAMPFGPNPASLDGVDFFDGTATEGMIVFKTAGTYSITPSAAADVEALVIAGGGGGERQGGGGGGGYTNKYAGVPVNNSVALAVVVGAAGLGGTGGNPTDGGYSRFGSDTTYQSDGGKGGVANTPGNGGDGGTGGNGYDIAGRQTDGANGLDAGTGTGVGGTGQGTTTTHYGFLYSTGGQSVAGASQVTNDPNTGDGGDGGNGSSVNGKDGAVGIVIVRWGGYNMNYNPTTDAVEAA